MKNKPKIGNLTEKQAQHALSGKCNKTKNQQVNLIKKHGGKSEKQTQNDHISIKTRPICLYEQIETWNCHKIWRKSNQKNRNLQKTSPKNKYCIFLLKQAQKQATHKSSKKPATAQKNKPKFAGKPQGWQYCKSVTTCSSIFCPLTGSAEVSPLHFTDTVKW